MVYEQNNPGWAVSKQAGFSLIEVVLTLVILGLLMGVVTTNLRGAGLRNVVKAEKGQLALLIEDLRTVSLYANRDLSLQAYLNAAYQTPDNDPFSQYLPSLSFESQARRQLLAERILLDSDLLVRPPGACGASEGAYTLSNGLALSFTIAALTCDVQLG